MGTFADRIIDFNTHLNYEAVRVMELFYRKFYNDNHKRHFIIGINPSRHGAGVTGVPFTDTKHLASDCGIVMQNAHTHEVSSVFMYDMIQQYGGTASFYHNFYINSPFPLAIIRQTAPNKWVNANYYDDMALFESIKGYMCAILQKNIAMGVFTEKVFVLGKKNATFLEKLNKEVGLFDEMVVLEHPRYIQQYKSKEKQLYIDKFLKSFCDIL